MTRATTFRAAAVFSGFLIAILMVMTVSRAAFTDPTSNDDNIVGAGTVYLDNNADNNTDSSTAPGDGTGDPMFDFAAGSFSVEADNLAPGDSVTNCIQIIFAGSLDADVLLDSITVGDDADGLANNIDLDITRYDDDAADCTGTSEGAVVGAADTLASFTISETAWSPLGGSGDTKYYGVTLTLIDDAALLDSDQGATVEQIDFEWLATNT